MPNRPLMIGIAGGTGSGKTTVARRVAAALADSSVAFVEMDSYYKNHIGMDRRHGLIRTWTATHAARHDGAQLPNLISKANTASAVWADTAYRSKSNEQHLAESGLRSQIHRKKPAGRPMAKNVARANNARSKVRAGVEHVFACQKGPMALVVRTIGLARATVKIGLANLAYNMRRAVWLTSQRQARA